MQDIIQKPGRPSLRSAELALAICDSIARGTSLVATLKQPGMPAYRTAMDWLDDDPEFARDYSRAMEARADKMAEEIVALSDEKPPVIIDSNGESHIDSAWVQLQRLRVDTRKWMASKMSPKRYGDAGASVNVNVAVAVDQQWQSLNELRERIAKGRNDN